MSDQSKQTDPTTDPEKWNSIGVLAVFMITLPVIIGIVIFMGPPISDEAALESTASYRSSASSAAPSAPSVSPGELVYQNTCKVCHGPDANGVVMLGKPLRNNAYIQNSDDSELFRNIADGRMPDHPLNTTGVVMPARGAQNITDAQINDVIVYLHSLQDPSQPLADMSAWVVEKTAPAVAFDGPGRDLFLAMCSACHGPNGEGMDGLGKPFTSSAFVKNSTDKEIMTMVKMGRPIWDAANTTGVDMPPKGGNPAMTDDQLSDIIAYIRSIDTLED